MKQPKFHQHNLGDSTGGLTNCLRAWEWRDGRPRRIYGGPIMLAFSPLGWNAARQRGEACQQCLDHNKRMAGETVNPNRRKRRE